MTFCRGCRWRRARQGEMCQRCAGWLEAVEWLTRPEQGTDEPDAA